MHRIALLLLGALAVPALATAQGHGRTRRTSAASAGEVALPPNPGRASADVEQFQRALRDVGCDPGRIDGIIGPSTGRAIACARRKGVVPSAPGAEPYDTSTATSLAHDVFPNRPAAVAGEAATPPNAAAQAPTNGTTVTGIPVPTVNAAHDSTISGRNAARDSTLSGAGTGTPPRGRTPRVRPDTAHR